jgi:4-diphosphocytidyl-2-C-methyl-D-erythritol kinase
VSVSTQALFSASELTRDAQAITIRDYLADGGASSGRNEAGGVGNVFEPIARERYPVIDRALAWLSDVSGTQAKMTGTGSSIFVPVVDGEQAERITAQVPQEWRAFYAQGKNRSPLKIKLNSLS